MHPPLRPVQLLAFTIQREGSQKQEKWLLRCHNRKTSDFFSYVFTVQSRRGQVLSPTEAEIEIIFPDRLESACLLSSYYIQLL